MRIEEFKRVVKSMVKNKVKTPVVAVGSEGIGKTESIKQVSKELGIPYSILRLGSMQDVGDMLGMMQVVKYQDGTEMSIYAPPSWFKTIHEKGCGILFIDEINRCKPQLQDAVMQLLDQGRFNDFVLPENAIIVGAMNPNTDEFDVNEQDAAFIDRIVAVPVHNTVEDVLTFAIQNNWDNDIIDFIAYAGNDLILRGSVKLPPKKFTARSLRQLNDFMPVIREVPEAANDIVLGCVGPDGFEKWKFREIYKKVPTAAQYFNNPDKYNVGKFTLPEQMILVSRVVRYLSEKNDLSIAEKNIFTQFCASLSEPVYGIFLRLAASSSKICQAVQWITDKKLIEKSKKILDAISESKQK